MKKKILGTLLVLALVLSLGLIALPASADVIEVVPGEGTPIQDAIDSASPSDTISVASGLYVEDLDITVDNLELSGTGATLKGIATSTVGDAPNIEILADGVSVHGFTIEAPDRVPGEYFSGVFIDGTDVEIYDNHFIGSPAETVEELSLMVATYMTGYSPLMPETTDVSGLYVHDNTFIGSGEFGSCPVWVMSHVGTGTIRIESNTLSGAINIGITVEAGNASVVDNTISTTLDEGTAPYGTYGVRFMNAGSPADFTGLVASGNDISGFNKAIRVGNGGAGSSFVATVSNNILDVDNVISIWGRAYTVGSIVAVDNSLGVVQNDDTTITIDAEYNWWGQSTGPNEGNTEGNVNTGMWLLTEGGVHYDKTMALPAGWSIISPDHELASYSIADSVLEYSYNAGFCAVASLDPITPVFVKTASGGGIGFNYKADSIGMFATTLEDGWNLIGIPSTTATSSAVLSPIRYGANNEVALATLVSQGNYNPEGVTFYESMLDVEGGSVPTLYPYDGYWAYMNVAKEFGVVEVE